MKFVLTFFITLLPLTAQASDYEYLLDDIDTLQSEIESLDQAREYLEADRLYESSPELFPRGPQYEEPVDANVRVGTVSDTHVQVRVKEVPVLLKDVPLDQWFAPYVRDVGELGIISGYKNADGSPRGEFGPADNVTLAQLAKIAVNAAQVDIESCPEKPVNQSASGTWAQDFVSCAEYYRWSVFLESNLDIAREATRAEVVTTILDAFASELVPATGEVFADVSNTFVFRSAIETAHKDGIISGYKDEAGNDTSLFGPFNKINRAETAKIVSLAVQIYGR